MGEKYPALPYSDTMWDDSKNGVLTVEGDSWKEFEKTLIAIAPKNSYNLLK
jgi:hypothetical protein